MPMSQGKKIQTPTSIILLGATGDLAQKKLLPALIDLFEKDVLPDYFYLLAFSRNPLSDNEYRAFAREHIEAKGKTYDPILLENFLSKIEYTHGTFEDKEAFARIKEKLEAHDESVGMCSSKLFYLAVPPTFYDTIFEQIAAVKLEQPCIVGEGWTRILVEKPFGSDLENAQHLEKKLSKLFHEEQIYRIDHYLAKDALQNIISFRFSNVLFEDRWNKDFVEGVHIQVSEKFDVANRGAFFDAVGALRDVGQNHILQMLALIAMNRPEGLQADELRVERTKILRSLQIPDSTDLYVKGQYEGYRAVKNVDPTSNTETYFMVKAFIDTEEWRGVPFYLEHGKALDKNHVAITVRFRPSKNCVCNNPDEIQHSNFVTFLISPEQKITLRFWVRKPGLKYDLEQKELMFDRNGSVGEGVRIADAYEGVLFDALSGDQTLFVSSAEQEAAWKYITAVLKLWHDTEPVQYAPGTTGPDSELKSEVKKILQ